MYLPFYIFLFVLLCYLKHLVAPFTYFRKKLDKAGFVCYSILIAYFISFLFLLLLCFLSFFFFFSLLILGNEVGYLYNMYIYIYNIYISRSNVMNFWLGLAGNETFAG